MRVTITHPHQAPGFIRRVDVGAVNGVNAEADHVAPPGRNGNRVFQPVNIGGQVGAARALGRLIERVTAAAAAPTDFERKILRFIMSS